MSRRQKPTTTTDHNRKPVWPYPEVTTMTPHPCGQWVKKCRGTLWYFGPWSDPKEALRRWRAEWDSIVQTNERPGEAPDAGAMTLWDALTDFLAAKSDAVDRGELSLLSYGSYQRACKMVTRIIGRDTTLDRIGPADFQRVLAAISERAPATRARVVAEIRTAFRWIDDQHEYRVRLGREFRGPPARVLRKERRHRMGRTFTPREIHRLIRTASPRDKAVLLLAINGGFGQRDLANLPAEHVDLDAGWIRTIRDKTGADRTVPLWPETVKRLRPVAYPSGYLLRSRSGKPLVRGSVDLVEDIMRRLKKRAGLNHGTFYWLRYTFATIAAETGDEHARKLLMGHVIDGISERYVLEFPRERLLAVSNHVRSWLFRGSRGRGVASGGDGGES